ncbi:LPS assembly lipoprotein LptE [Parasegetibacter sp. NRK P23]|uniref:LPS assembly lipoprotein LptE n=1 Tax=Parasegetibacter sp. NRK P23 TaxID=2942999 RepID=UPI0020430899|nr:LPS assembly lipoprotein LptE [Parasegetibacter sp. NRK P23]MCM5528180.1 LPS assembly lipoprotein LptE [Parasegetibacter sp. NRK P23]
MNRIAVFTRFLTLIGILWLLPGCYTFKDVSIPPEIKTVKVNYLENKARYINPTLSPQLTDRLRQKIVNQTRLIQTNNDDAHYVISGQITGYDVITTGVSQQQASVNRLNVTFHLELRDNVNNKDTESDISRSFDFSANLSLSQAEAQLREDILKNLTDEIFNKIFSNW